MSHGTVVQLNTTQSVYKVRVHQKSREELTMTAALQNQWHKHTGVPWNPPLSSPQDTTSSVPCHSFCLQSPFLPSDQWWLEGENCLLWHLYPGLRLDCFHPFPGVTWTYHCQANCKGLFPQNCVSLLCFFPCFVLFSHLIQWLIFCIACVG